ncbi:MAG: helix-turn-helix domain-containing protein, partial [Betaproteobacteria bacterium]
MGSRYRHFSIEERCEIARRRQAGESIRQVAAALDRSP